MPWRQGGKTHMRAFGNDRVAVLVGRIQVERIELVLQTERCTGIFMPAKGLLLKIERHAVPVLERYSDPAQDNIATAAHPLRTLSSDPNKLLQRRRINDGRVARPILETHQV